MCFSQPKMPAMPEPPPPAPMPVAPPPPTKMAKEAPTERQVARKGVKKVRGTQQVTAVRRPSVGMGGAGGSGVQLSS